MFIPTDVYYLFISEVEVTGAKITEAMLPKYL